MTIFMIYLERDEVIHLFHCIFNTRLSKSNKIIYIHKTFFKLFKNNLFLLTRNHA